MRKFYYWLLVLGTWIIAVVYFLSCFTPYVSPVTFWPMSFLALGFPYVAVCLLLVLAIWIFVRRRVALYLLIVLLIGFKNLHSTLAVNFSGNKKNEAPANHLRILTWNLRSFQTPVTEIYSPNSVRMQMFKFIDSTKADILCLQEFVHFEGDKFYSNIDILDSLGYHYYYFPFQKDSKYSFGTLKQGTAIFSRLPFTQFGKTLLGDSSLPEYLIFADFLFGNRPIRIFAAHFKSIHLFQGSFDPDNIAPLHYDSTFVFTASRFTKLKVFGQEHAKQAYIAKKEMNASKYPLVLGMDMNSVPTSYAYHYMQSGLQDAFVTKGHGLGTTLDSLPATLRIDFLLVDKKFAITNYLLKPLHLSDHYPQVIDVSWKR